MLFNSITFLIFLPIVFLLYWFVFGEKFKIQNIFIVVVSYIFYGWWDWRFLFLIGFISFCSWLGGFLMLKKRERLSNAEDTQEVRIFCQRVVAGNVILNLLFLSFFKYYNFFVSSVIDSFTQFGVTLDYHTMQIILPVGISFYTFQALSYSIDVYRRKTEPTRDIVSFFAFVSFFPQLVAGPIERSTQLLPQFFHPRSFKYAQTVDGMRQILWGFFKKVVVADNCALLVNSIFTNQDIANSSALLLGAFLFTFQIYCDFSGYSDIAVGTARLFGFDLMRNFNVPYFSRDIAEFWRRWHISLNTWFRDYIYIPLGGSRGSKSLAIRNTLLIFMVSGLWHGANWTYVVWGIYHGLLFLPLYLLGKNRINVNTVVAYNRIFPSLKECFQLMTTFFLVLIGWVIFRSESIGKACSYLKKMFDTSLWHAPNYAELGIGNSVTMGCFLFIAILLVVEWLQRDKDHGLAIDEIRSATVRWSIYLVVALIIFFFRGVQETFIYFQF